MGVWFWVLSLLSYIASMLCTWFFIYIYTPLHNSPLANILINNYIYTCILYSCTTAHLPGCTLHFRLKFSKTFSLLLLRSDASCLRMTITESVITAAVCASNMLVYFSG